MGRIYKGVVKTITAFGAFVEILPGKSALTLAGDDIVQKSQNSIDIESADKDLRLNAFKNVQIMAQHSPVSIFLQIYQTEQRNIICKHPKNAVSRYIVVLLDQLQK